MLTKGEDDDKNLHFGADMGTENLEHDLTGTYPGGQDARVDKWHHLAVAYKNNQVKVYADQTRVLNVPDFDNFKPEWLKFAGIGDQENPLLIRNVRIAAGGGMTLTEKLTKEGKIVTHGIQFDINSGTIKPQSMGTINEVAKALKGNPALKLEIGGHTDTSGDAARNLTLSQARADAVKKMLVDQGVDASRLTTKGYGASKPMDSNNTPEGMANNRRVEFTKTT